MNFIDQKKAKKDKNGIWVTDLLLSEEAAVSKSAWEKIYNFNLKKLIEDRENFNRNKLNDHMRYIDQTYSFSSRTVYLEIGCGPAHIGEHLIEKYNVTFVGVDFNYPMLLTLKKYFDKKGYKKYVLIHADINAMPIKNNSIDYIYGGGVIEHLPDTNKILSELYRILKKGGIAFNTVPAFSLWWSIRCFNNIPFIPGVKQIFEYIHLKVLQSKILEKYYGYELSYTIPGLRSLHKKNKFKNIAIGSFAFYPSEKKLSNKFLRDLYYYTQTNIYTTAIYYVSAKK